MNNRNRNNSDRNRRYRGREEEEEEEEERRRLGGSSRAFRERDPSMAAFRERDPSRTAFRERGPSSALRELDPSNYLDRRPSEEFSSQPRASERNRALRRGNMNPNLNYGPGRDSRRTRNKENIPPSGYVPFSSEEQPPYVDPRIRDRSLIDRQLNEYDVRSQLTPPETPERSIGTFQTPPQRSNREPPSAPPRRRGSRERSFENPPRTLQDPENLGEENNSLYPIQTQRAPNQQRNPFETPPRTSRNPDTVSPLSTPGRNNLMGDDFQTPPPTRGRSDPPPAPSRRTSVPLASLEEGPSNPQGGSQSSIPLFPPLPDVEEAPLPDVEEDEEVERNVSRYL